MGLLTSKDPLRRVGPVKPITHDPLKGPAYALNQRSLPSIPSRARHENGPGASHSGAASRQHPGSSRVVNCGGIYTDPHSPVNPGMVGLSSGSREVPPRDLVANPGSVGLAESPAPDAKPPGTAAPTGVNCDGRWYRMTRSGSLALTNAN